MALVRQDFECDAENQLAAGSPHAGLEADFECRLDLPHSGLSLRRGRLKEAHNLKRRRRTVEFEDEVGRAARAQLRPLKAFNGATLGAQVGDDRSGRHLVVVACPEPPSGHWLPHRLSVIVRLALSIAAND